MPLTKDDFPLYEVSLIFKLNKVYVVVDTDTRPSVHKGTYNIQPNGLTYKFTLYFKEETLNYTLKDLKPRSFILVNEKKTETSIFLPLTEQLFVKDTIRFENIDSRTKDLYKRFSIEY